MARVELLLQAVTDTTHADAIRLLLKDAKPVSILFSVGFVREAGVEAIEPAIKPVASRTSFFVGIRNGVTTAQGVKRLLSLKAEVFAVDTGTRETIFHPKLYLLCEKQRALLIIGSANVTHQGLHNNIEASAIVTLDMADAHDKKFVEEAVAAFEKLPRQHPKHAFRIKDQGHADQLFSMGLLADERVVTSSVAGRWAGEAREDSLPRMKLRQVPRPRIRATFRKAAPKTKAGPSAPAPVPTATVPGNEFHLEWESKQLSERDLNIPSGLTTHATGSMGLKKGALEDIDQRHFFRQEVFKGIAWETDPHKPHLERAEASFHVVVKGVDYGAFTLRLTHNTDVKSRSYKQKNEMTHLRWDDAKKIISRRDLLGRKMFLYRKDVDPPEFVIEID
jgi:HKD family nuclease